LADNTVSFPGVTTTGAASSLAGAPFSRASSATYFDSTLTLQTAAPDVLRPAYDPILGTPFTLIEPAGVNWVRNSRGEGGGAFGSTTLPTNWSMSNTGGVTPTMVGTGIEDGIPYADIRWSGSSTGAYGLQFEATNGIPATIGQQWVVSVYIRLMAGTISSSVFNVGIYTYNSSRTFLIGYAQNTANQPTNAPLKTQRYRGCSTLAAAGIAYMSGPRVALSLTPGVVDFTLRFGLPQAELLPYPTNLLPPACGGWVGSSNAQSMFQPDPYGQSNALLVMDTAVTGSHYVNVGTPNTPNNQITTYSVYIKYAGRRYCYMQMVDNSITGNVIAVYIDLLTGTLVNPAAVGTATIIAQTITPVTDAVSPGWYRVSLSGILSTTVDTTITCRLWTINDTFASSYSGTGIGFYFYAPQFQVGPLSPYISTDPTSAMLASAGLQQITSRQTDLTGTYYVVGEPLAGVESSAIAGAIPLLVGIGGTASVTGVGSVGPNPCGMPIRGATGYGRVQDYATGMGRFTRASYAAYHDSNGVLQLAPPDVLRPGYDPVTGNYYGSLIEGASTNFIRNPTGLGAVVGSPGTMPTNWSIPSTGLTRQIVGTGVEDGISYVDIRQFGTTTNALNHMIFETGTAIPAVAGQQWVVSVYVRLVAGSLSGIAGFCLLTYYNNSAGTAIVTMGTTSDGSPFPTNAPLRTQRYTMTSSPAPNASIVYHSGPGIRLQSLTIGNAYDFTLRIGLPQAELVANTPLNMISPVGASWQQQAAPVTYWQPDCVGTSRAV